MDFLGNIRTRARVVKALRGFFDGLGFVEVETPVRIAAPAPEPHIDCPRCGCSFLRASPELQMKRLLAAGLPRIYQIGPCFREGERGSRHAPEFTMLEWYRAEAGYMDIARDMEELVGEVLRARWGASGPSPFTWITVREAYRRWAGWDPIEAWDQDRFDFDMATKIEPAIKEMGGGVFLVDYPPQAASLARVSADGLTGLLRAERWEFYVDGLELANCFTELCDRDEQARRFEAARANRCALGESEYPLDAGFLDVLPAIGAASGAALGVDRLVMVLTGVKEISAVRAKI